MPSDFEKEYKNYIESDMPDLWGRIEKGISEEKKVVRWPIVVRRIGQIAAVAAVGLISLSAVLLLFRGKLLSSSASKGSSDNAAAAPAPAAYEAAADTAEASYSAAEEDAWDEYAMAEAAGADDSYEKAATEEAEEAFDFAAADSAPEAENGMVSETAEAAAEKTGESKTESRDYTALNDGDDRDMALMFKDAELLYIEEIDKADRKDGEENYRYALEFRSGNKVIRCLLSEENAERAEADGVELTVGDTYRIFVINRDEAGDSDYPYELLNY